MAKFRLARLSDRRARGISAGNGVGNRRGQRYVFGGKLDQQTKQLTGGLQASVVGGDWADKTLKQKCRTTWPTASGGLRQSWQ